MTGFWMYGVIFVGKVIEVAVGTLRIMFVGKGQKLIGTLLGLVEIFLWVTIAGSVLKDIYADPLKAVVYCAAFTCGIYLGMLMEQWLALGFTSMQIVCAAGDSGSVAAALRNSGFGVTLIPGHSVNGTPRELIFVQLRRRFLTEAARLTNSLDPHAVISISDVRTVYGGFMKK